MFFFGMERLADNEIGRTLATALCAQRWVAHVRMVGSVSGCNMHSGSGGLALTPAQFIHYVRTRPLSVYHTIMVIIGSPEHFICLFYSQQIFLYQLRTDGAKLEYMSMCVHGLWRHHITPGGLQWGVPSQPTSFTFKEWLYGLESAIVRNELFNDTAFGTNFSWYIPSATTNIHVKNFMRACAYYIQWRSDGGHGSGRHHLIANVGYPNGNVADLGVA